MYICIYVYMYICIYVYIYICIYVYMYICIYVYMYICIYVYMYICIYVYMYICIYVYMYICICVIMCVYVCMSVCKYVLCKHIFEVIPKSHTFSSTFPATCSSIFTSCYFPVRDMLEAHDTTNRFRLSFRPRSIVMNHQFVPSHTSQKGAPLSFLGQRDLLQLFDLSMSERQRVHPTEGVRQEHGNLCHFTAPPLHVMNISKASGARPAKLSDRD